MNSLKEIYDGLDELVESKTDNRSHFDISWSFPHNKFEPYPYEEMDRKDWIFLKEATNFVQVWLNELPKYVSDILFYEHGHLQFYLGTSRLMEIYYGPVYSEISEAMGRFEDKLEDIHKDSYFGNPDIDRYRMDDQLHVDIKELLRKKGDELETLRSGIIQRWSVEAEKLLEGRLVALVDIDCTDDKSLRYALEYIR